MRFCSVFVYYNRCLAHKLDTAALLAYLRETYDGVYQSRREVRAHLDTLRKLIDDAKNAYFRKYEALRDPKGQGPIEEEAYFRWLYQPAGI